MQGAEHEQAEEAAEHPGREGGAVAFGRVHLEGGAVAEEEGEEQVELGLDEHHDQPVRRLVQTTGARPVAAPPFDARHHQDIGEEDAAEREAAQRVDLDDAVGPWHHGCGLGR
ncbi:hypothetical protein ACIQD5_04975 [Streptomyces microflavus]|uniref:hypothetical protein n=1 Tax=Streptomyces microflavus TaxID=1919 RepID=UPI0036894545